MMQKLHCKGLLLGLLLGIGTMHSHAQTDSNGKIKGGVSADYLFRIQRYDEAAAKYYKLLEEKNTDSSQRGLIKFQLARLYYESRKLDKSISLYAELAQAKDNRFSIDDVNNYLDLLKRTGKIQRALEVARYYEDVAENDSRYQYILSSLTEYSSFYNMKTNLNYVVNLLIPNSANTAFFYGLTHNQDNLIFMKKEGTKKPIMYQMSPQENLSSFQDALNIKTQLGPAAFYDQGNKIIFTSNKYTNVRTEKRTHLDVINQTVLMYSEKRLDGTWSEPAPIRIQGGVGKKPSLMHPSVLPDGSRMYFAATEMKDGKGGSDLYYTDWLPEKKIWSAPVSLGERVNTSGNEVYPHVQGERLFFASNGLKGFGGQDIFVLNLQDMTQEARHLPYPVNTPFDDMNGVLDAKKGIFYFTSNREGTSAYDNIYTLDLNQYPLAGVYWHTKGRKDSVQYSRSTNALEAAEQMPNLLKQAFNTKYVVHYAWGSHELDQASYKKLDALTRQLQTVSAAGLVIAGHSSEDGSKQYNKSLSIKRAQTVKQYLRQAGISIPIQIVGYGETQPISPKASLTQNRRAEIILLKP